MTWQGTRSLISCLKCIMGLKKSYRGEVMRKELKISFLIHLAIILQHSCSNPFLTSSEVALAFFCALRILASYDAKIGPPWCFLLYNFITRVSVKNLNVAFLTKWSEIIIDVTGSLSVPKSHWSHMPYKLKSEFLRHFILLSVSAYQLNCNISN